MKNNKNFKGFSLIEGLIALTVLSVGLMAVAGLFSQSASEQIMTSRVVTASGLAQEGVELVRVARNNNIVKGFSAFDGLDAGDNYRIDPEVSSLQLTVQKNSTITPSNDYFKLAVHAVSGNSRNLYQHAVPGGGIDLDYPVFWRKIYIADYPSSGTVTGRSVASLVFYREPSSWPTSIAQVPTACTLSVGCVYSQTVIQE